MLHNNVKQIDAYKANQPTIKITPQKNTAYYQPLAGAKGKTVNVITTYDYPLTSTLNQEISTLDSQQVSASRNKVPLGKNIQNMMQLFEPKNKDIATNASDDSASSNSDNLPTDFLSSLNAFYETYNELDSASERISTDHNKDVIGASSSTII